MYLYLCSFLLILGSVAGFAGPVVPLSLQEIGFASGQSAAIFSQSSTLLYFREDRFRRRLGISDSISSEALGKSVLRNAAYLTRQQMNWDGFIMRLAAQPDDTRLVFHVPSYGRGSNAGFLDEDSVDWTLRGPGKLPLDHKGTGLTSMEPHWQAMYIDMILLLRGEEPRSFQLQMQEVASLGENQLEGMREQEVRIRALQAESGLSKDDAAGLAHVLRNVRAEIEIMDAFLEGLQQRVDGIAPLDNQMRLLKAVASKDYRNGLFEAARGLREAIIGEIAEVVFAIVNPIWKTDLQTVPIDYVIALPVTMHSISYGRDLTAGVLGRAPQFREDHGGIAKHHFWTPKGLFESQLPGSEQFDVNGNFVDLELMNFTVPGIEQYFKWDVNAQRLDRLCIEATEAFLNGDKEAVQKLIETILSKIDRTALEQWARQNPPPKDCPATARAKAKDPFFQARDLLLSAKASGKKIVDKDKARLRSWLLALRKQFRGDQISALIPTLFEVAPEEAEFLWRNTLATTEPKTNGKKAKSRPVDARFLMQIAAQLIFPHSVDDNLAPQKLAFATEMAKNAPGLFVEMYSELGAEFFRRQLSQRGQDPTQYFSGQIRHTQVFNLVPRLALASLARVAGPAVAELAARGLEEKYTLFQNEEESVIDGIAALCKAGLGEILIETVEHLIGAEFPNSLLLDLFPEESLAQIQFHLAAQRTYAGLSSGQRIGCVMSLLKASGLSNMDPEEMLGIERLFNLFGDGEDNRNRRLPSP